MLKAIKDYDLKRVISFHSRVKRAEQFSTGLQEVLGWVADEHKPGGTLWTDYVSGAMPTDRRKQKLDRLKAIAADQRGVLTNARCLSEGVDVPALDGIAFIDPRSSQVDIVQAVGRAIRLSADKKFGTIVLPVFIKDGEDAAASIEASNFKPVWEILNALKSHDEELAFELDQLRTEMGRKAGTKIGAGTFDKIAIDLPATVDADFGDSLRTYLVEQTTASWEFWFGLLDVFVGKEGHTNVLRDYRTVDGYRLGQWIEAQRRIKNSLVFDRKLRLEKLPNWSWSPLDDKWEKGFRYLQEFADREGHSRVSHGYKTPDEFRLGLWVSNRRKDKDSMTAERKSRLESLPGWSWDARDDNWEDAFRRLKEFVDREGHAKIIDDYKTPDGYRLGGWVSKQRMTSHSLSLDRKTRLESLPSWSWDPREEKWEEGFRYIKEFSEQEGHARVPKDYKAADGFRLYQWVQVQRREQSKMSAGRKARLEALLDWSWNTFSDKWEEGFRHLKEFSDREGHCSFSAVYKTADGYRLGQWVTMQRRHRDNISSERKNQLEALPSWSWDARADMWEKGFCYLNEFADREGHCLVPVSYKTADGYRLGGWVNIQRTRKGSLSSERKAQLEALSGWVWQVKNKSRVNE